MFDARHTFNRTVSGILQDVKTLHENYENALKSIGAPQPKKTT